MYETPGQTSYGLQVIVVGTCVNAGKAVYCRASIESTQQCTPHRNVRSTAGKATQHHFHSKVPTELKLRRFLNAVFSFLLRGIHDKRLLDLVSHKLRYMSVMALGFALLCLVGSIRATSCWEGTGSMMGLSLTHYFDTAQCD